MDLIYDIVKRSAVFKLRWKRMIMSSLEFLLQSKLMN